MRESGSSRRLEAWLREKRKSAEGADAVRDEKMSLGGEILDVFSELRARPELGEALRMYLGMVGGKVLLGKRWVGEYAFHEEYVLEEDGGLTYVVATAREPFLWGPGEDRCPVRCGEKPLRSVLDFYGVPLESIRWFHGEATREDFFDRVAWRSGRVGKPGFREEGYEDEQRTRLYS